MFVVMSQSSATSSIKYEKKICKCGLKTTIMLAETSKNPGRLFYHCSNCGGFVSWCDPVNLQEIANEFGNSSQQDREEKNYPSQESYAIRIQLKEHEIRLRYLESKQEFQTTFGIIMMVVMFIILLLFIVLKM